jgi:L-threonylcarbamoyladenylate synthase
VSAELDRAVAALRGGKLAVVPTDTVYGLAASPEEAPARRLYEAKGRDAKQPTALVVSSLGTLLELLPELRGATERVARALLPGPYTLVVPNPARRYPWLTGATPDAIGVRVPKLTGVARRLLARVGALTATSANLPGGPDPRTLAAVPDEIRLAADALLDGGELAGTPSTVLDLTGPEPRVLREGAVSSAEALRLVTQLL